MLEKVVVLVVVGVIARQAKGLFIPVRSGSTVDLSLSPCVAKRQQQQQRLVSGSPGSDWLLDLRELVREPTVEPRSGVGLPPLPGSDRPTNHRHCPTRSVIGRLPA